MQIRMRIRILLFSSVTFKTSTKFFAYYFLKVHLYHFSKLKSHKEVTKQWEGSWSGSGSISLTNGSWSGRPKNTCILRIRIRIRIRNTACSTTLRFSLATKANTGFPLFLSIFSLDENMRHVYAAASLMPNGNRTLQCFFVPPPPPPDSLIEIIKFSAGTRLSELGF